MFIFKKKESAGSDVPSPTPPPRPRLSDAFADELRKSVHQMQVIKEKKSRFGFLNPMKRAPSSGEESDSPNIPSVKSPPRVDRRRITKEMAEEMRKSFRDQNKQLDGARRMLKKGDSNSQPKQERRPTLSRELADELRMSFANRNIKKANRRKQIMNRIMQRRESQRMLQNVKLDPPDQNTLLTDGGDENDSENDRYKEPQHKDRGDERKDKAETSSKQKFRPSLNKEVAEELRQSFHNRIAKLQDRRQQIASRIMQRRESQRLLTNAPPSSIAAQSRIGMTDSGAVNPESEHESLQFGSGGFQSSMQKTSMNSRRSVDFDTSVVSFADDTDDARPRGVPEASRQFPGLGQRLEQRSTSRNKTMSRSAHSTDTFQADFSDDESSNRGIKKAERRREKSAIKHKPESRSNSQSQTRPVETDSEPSSSSVEIAPAKDGDFDT